MEVNLFKVTILLSLMCFVVSDHITVFAPPSFRNRQPYNAFISTSHMSAPTSVVALFKNKAVYYRMNRMMLDNSINTRISLGKRGRNNTLVVVAKRGTQCVSIAQKLRRNNLNFHTFIQHDKPIYRPGDNMTFRIVTVDPNVLPYQIHNIKIEVIDTDGNIMHTYESLEDQPYHEMGIFQGIFPFSNYPNLGNWTMRVWIDKSAVVNAEKEFVVEKSLLPFYSVKIDVYREILSNSNRFDLTFSAKYSFGQYVKGKAKMTITHESTGIIYKQENFNVDTLIQKKYKLKEDLGITNIINPQTFIVKVEFEDDSSGTKMEKSERVTVTSKDKYEVRITPSSSYTPGMTYSVNVEIIDWMGNRLDSSSDPVKLVANKVNYTIRNIHETLDKGLARFDIETTKLDTSFDIEVTFFDKWKGNMKVTKSLVADHRIAVIVPKIITANSLIKLKLQSPILLNKVNLMIIGKSGMTYGTHKKCKNSYECEIEVQTSVEMMPRSQVRVYVQSGENSETFIKAEATLVFDQLGNNFLHMASYKGRDDTTSFQPKDDVTLRFKTQPESIISLLGINKRLTYLRDGHDIDEKNVVETLMKPPTDLPKKSNFDGMNYILKMDLDKWHSCTDDEMDTITKVEQSLGARVRNDLLAEVELDDDDIDETPEAGEDAETDQPYLRKYFPESWIFETITNVDSQGFAELTKTIPDSMTSWAISAFSMNKKHGLAIAKPIDLVVSKQFFVVLNLPYSMRFGEVLKLDIIVFNMIQMKGSKNVQANVEIIKIVDGKQQLKIVNFNNPGSCVTGENNQNTKSISIPHKAGTRTFFHIEPTVIGRMKIQVKVSTKVDKIIHYDMVQRELIVENEGIAFHTVKNHKIEFRTRNSSTLEREDITPPKNTDLETVRFTGTAIGHMMGVALSINFNEYNIVEPRGCASQRMSSFLQTFSAYRGLQATGRTHRNYEGQRYLQMNYQNLFNFRSGDGSFAVLYGQPSSTWTTAYVARILGQALRIGAISGSQSTISSALSYLSRSQNTDGSFSETGYAKAPTYPTETSRNVRYTSFVLLAFLENRNYYSYPTVISNAFGFIQNRLATCDNYAASIAALALAMDGKRTEAIQVLDILERSAIKSGNSHYWNLRGHEHTSQETVILITSYVALAYLRVGMADKASLAVAYLMSVRNPNGHFYSAHDTAMAMEAISEMAISQKRDNFYTGDTYDLSISLTNDKSHKEDMRITKSNWDQVQYKEMPKYTKDVTVRVDGIGYASFALVMEYYLVVDSNSTTYTLDLEYNRGDPQKAEVKACATNIGPDQEEMTMMTFTLTGGYVYDDSMDQVGGQISQKELKKGKTVIDLYIPAMKRNQRTCATVKAKKVFEISNFKRSSVKVYLYNEKTNIASRFFDMGQNSCL